MTGVELLEIFKKTGGYITDSHIIYTSGKHGKKYLNKDAIYPHTKEVSKICLEIATRFAKEGIEAVVSPALGGIILSQWTAYHLTNISGIEVLGIYTEKTPDKNQILTRGYDKLINGKNVLVVEDITTTGGSVKKVIESVREAHGIVHAVCVLVNRNPQEVHEEFLGVPFYPLAEVEMEAWNEESCPLCRDHIPINTTIGKPKDFLARKGFL